MILWFELCCCEEFSGFMLIFLSFEGFCVFGMNLLRVCYYFDIWILFFVFKNFNSCDVVLFLFVRVVWYFRLGRVFWLKYFLGKLEFEKG